MRRVQQTYLGEPVKMKDKNFKPMRFQPNPYYEGKQEEMNEKSRISYEALFKYCGLVIE